MSGTTRWRGDWDGSSATPTGSGSRFLSLGRIADAHLRPGIWVKVSKGNRRCSATSCLPIRQPRVDTFAVKTPEVLFSGYPMSADVSTTRGFRRSARGYTLKGDLQALPLYILTVF